MSLWTDALRWGKNVASTRPLEPLDGGTETRWEKSRKGVDDVQLVRGAKEGEECSVEPESANRKKNTTSCCSCFNHSGNVWCSPCSSCRNRSWKSFGQEVLIFWKKKMQRHNSILSRLLAKLTQLFGHFQHRSTCNGVLVWVNKPNKDRQTHHGLCVHQKSFVTNRKNQIPLWKWSMRNFWWLFSAVACWLQLYRSICEDWSAATNYSYNKHLFSYINAVIVQRSLIQTWILRKQEY